MVRPYSLDLRERVIAAVADGQSCRVATDTFGVSVASVVKWSQRFQSKDSAAAKPMAGRRPWLLAHIREEPDITVRYLAKAMPLDSRRKDRVRIR
ncbi:MAG: helix-turn-helix domain-containing protein, partial [Hyphomicrobiaceae bacterium]